MQLTYLLDEIGRSVLHKLFFFKIKYMHRVLYKLVLVTDHLYHSEDLKPFKLRLSFSGLGGLRTSSLEASGLQDTNLNTLSTQTPRGQKLQIWISPERVGEKTGCLAFIGISRPYFAITNKTRVQSSKIRNKFKN